MQSTTSSPVSRDVVITLPAPGLADLIERLAAPLPEPLLAAALVHRSWCAEHPGNPSNERLEFLGDAVLGLVVTDHVYRLHVTSDEGVLTEIRKSVVNSVTLAEVAAQFGVGDHLLLGRGEELSGGRAKPSILADALEAIIGATYLHAGLDAARDLVVHLMGERLSASRADGQDHKSRLQELAAQRCGAAPRYEVVASGPDHARTFDVTVKIAGEPIGAGSGRSKKQAEQAAARAALSALLDGAIGGITEAAGAISGPAGEPAPSEAGDG
jgi:ribonuclease III